MQYTLFLPQGVITKTKNGYVGSKTTGTWSPQSPDRKTKAHPNGIGWQSGDTLTVICAFNLEDGAADGPPATDYIGLCVAAVNNPTPTTVAAAEKSMYYTHNGMVGNGITTSTTPDNAKDIFYAATSTPIDPIQLDPASRGELTNLIHIWTMKFNPNYTGLNATNVEIIYGYGDPMSGDVDS